jgi:hypothetical protein
LLQDRLYLNIKQNFLGGSKMPTAVRVSDELVSEARKFSKVDHRSLTGQIEHWARIGKCAEENPDLTYDLIKEILIGIEELDRGEKSEYQFG